MQHSAHVVIRTSADFVLSCTLGVPHLAENWSKILAA
jgi:hypothetical protein